MKAAMLTEKGVEIREVPAPKPKPTEVLVRVRACGINRADLHVASGIRHGNMGGAGTVLGMEWAGEVSEVGGEVKDFKPGDRVICAGSGCWAEYAVADAGRTLPIPTADMGFEQAAALPIALNTLHDALMTQGKLKRGDSVLIQGASSAVGLMGLQIAKFLGAKPVIGTSTNAERRARLKNFGADVSLDSRDANWADEAIKATGGKGVDIIVDMVSGPTVNQSLQAASVLGRIVNIGRLGGNTAEFDFDTHSRKRIHYIGASFRTRSIEEIREINRRMKEDLWDAVSAGKLTVPLDEKFPLDRVKDAIARANANQQFGKVIITV
ncbi:MAG TPA: zinc-binding dehydrogenase [Xanthobacteraceae bacterium]|nr:zinc-binding dehydrogenase [Xanthobacteraceae bacterium]